MKLYQVVIKEDFLSVVSTGNPSLEVGISNFNVYLNHPS